MNAEQEVDKQWRWLIQDAPVSPEVRALIRAAAEVAPLRRLFPFLSLHRRLRFSAVTREPYQWHYPYIVHNEGSVYEARAGDGRPLLCADLDQALTTIVRELPDPPEEVRTGS
jgi:Family of unknown function (DUF6193)